MNLKTTLALSLNGFSPNIEIETKAGTLLVENLELVELVTNPQDGEPGAVVNVTTQKNKTAQFTLSKTELENSLKQKEAAGKHGAYLAFDETLRILQKMEEQETATSIAVDAEVLEL